MKISIVILLNEILDSLWITPSYQVFFLSFFVNNFWANLAFWWISNAVNCMSCGLMFRKLFLTISTSFKFFFIFVLKRNDILSFSCWSWHHTSRIIILSNFWKDLCCIWSQSKILCFKIFKSFKHNSWCYFKACYHWLSFIFKLVYSILQWFDLKIFLFNNSFKPWYRKIILVSIRQIKSTS